MTQQTQEPVKYARCRQPVEKPIYREIFFIGFDGNRKRSMSETLPFCSAEHASHEQMSREG
ncbi:hypothetical protein NJI34_28495 [Pseudomonas sp. S 311-6]|uniref:hypothetical protein n=1 Tax=Pseudomonas TaxID=286 RepID=UPI0020973D5E|nr:MULTISPECIES: hypothetical protein [Pseudomonas]MCO7566409.1 hypothetical protein [Pseudomonas mosselii]MCO7617437.1 hypothetical protein [Pseudomonas guariconensis]MCO7640715.1 hypothetical protein [Pseudomonas sp. S 311-6]